MPRQYKYQLMSSAIVLGWALVNAWPGKDLGLQIISQSGKQRALQKYYVADVICYGKILCELKALDKLSGKEAAQVINYLKATGVRLGLLINFGSDGVLEWKRLVK